MRITWRRHQRRRYLVVTWLIIFAVLAAAVVLVATVAPAMPRAGQWRLSEVRRHLVALGGVVAAVAGIVAVVNKSVTWLWSRGRQGWAALRRLAVGRPHTLPYVNWNEFTGREKERDLIGSVVATRRRRHAGVNVVVLQGIGGVGKSTLAAVVAHEHWTSFRHVEWWDFRAYPDGTPRDTNDALAHLLQRLAGRSAQDLPDDESLRVSLWREWACTRSTLLVLENVTTFAQVENLIPGDGRHLILVTTRDDPGHLSNVTPETIHLDGLGPTEALSLLETVAGRKFEATERDDAQWLVARIDCLPLAIQLLAAALRNGTSTVARLRAELDARGSLEVVDERLRGRETVSMAAEVAFTRLSPPTQRVFCLLSLHPFSSDIDFDAAWALTEAPRLEYDLRELCAASLLRPIDHGGARLRYKLHDLLRRYAQTKLYDSQLGISPDEIGAAVNRLFTYYWRTADAMATEADSVLPRHTRPKVHPLPDPGTLPDPGSCRASTQRVARTDASVWFEEHGEHLLACLDHAREHQLDVWTVRLASAMAGFLRNRGPWDQAIRRHAEAVAAADRLGDHPAGAVARNDLGIMYRWTGDFDEALRVLSEAHAIFDGELPPHISERDAWVGRANARHEQGIVHNERGNHNAAVEALEPALDLYRKADDPIGIANAQKNLGVALYHIGLEGSDGDLLSHASQLLADAMAGYATIGDVLGEVEVHNHRGRLRLKSGDPRGALDDFSIAARRIDGVGSLLEEARAAEGIGRCHQGQGDHNLWQRLRGEHVRARRYLGKAEQIYATIGAEKHRRRVAEELGRLGVIPPPDPRR